MFETDLTPVNQTAKRVIQKGIHYIPSKKISQAHFEIQPAIIPIPGNSPVKIGYKFGRFTVIGGARSGNGNKCALYVVRCTCGHYEYRTAKAIFNPKNNLDMCQICRDLIYLKRFDEYRQHGYNEDSWTNFGQTKSVQNEDPEARKIRGEMEAA